MNSNGSLPQWLTFGAVVLACFLLSVGGIRPVKIPGGDAMVASSRDGAARDVARLAAAVERLETVLARKLDARREALARETEPGGAADRGMADTATPAGKAAGGTGGPADRDPEMVRLLGTPTRTEVVDALLLAAPDTRSIQQVLLLSSYREILERFGFPTSVATGNAGVRFSYAYTASAGTIRSLTLWFQDGIVVDVYR